MVDAAPNHDPEAEGTMPPGASTELDAASAADALVDEMERESFPASDPPSTWAGPEET